MVTLAACSTLTAVQAQVSPARLEAARRAQAERDQAKQAQDPASFITPNQDKAQEIGERVYNTWRLGMIRGNEGAWRGATTTSRQMKVRNLIVSQRGDFPRDFFKHDPVEPPMLENFKYVGALAACQGRTMALTYVGRVQLGKEKSKEAAFVILMVDEGGKWKYDQSRFFMLDKLPAVRKRLVSGDVSVLREQDGFYPYAQIPKTPAACPKPQLIGKLFVDAPGREIEIKINGVSEHEFADERRADVIGGGLRRGTNTISYRIKDIPGQASPSFAIGLFVMPETKGNEPIVVFEHIVDAKDAATGGNFTFHVTNDMILAMNPSKRVNGAKPAPFRPVPLKQKGDAAPKAGAQ